jgi:hypothetical protein
VNNVVYNSAQFIVQKRYSSGLSFLLATPSPRVWAYR